MHLAQTPQFKVETVMAADKPQTLAYLALHQDYSADFVTSTQLDEGKCGELVVDRLLKGNRGHYGPLEHPSITMAIRADHPTIMQLRTHRHLTFDVQSMRYTSEHIVDVAEEKLDVEDTDAYAENLSVIKESFFSDKPIVENKDVQEENDEIILEEQEVTKPSSDYTSINALVEAFNTKK